MATIMFRERVGWTALSVGSLVKSWDMESRLVRWLRTIGHLLIVLATAGQASLQLMLLRLRGPLTREQRARWLHRCCATGLRRLNITYSAAGRFPERGLIVSNHLGYLDIMVYSALAPCVFVAKREISSWPLFGFMSRMAGTIFIDRERRSDTHRVNQEMQDALAAGAVVVLFPEGTSSDGITLLPFRPALFEAALATGEPMTCAHIGYVLEDGTLDQPVCFWGEMTFLPHVLQVLAKRTIRGQVRFQESGERFTDRKQAAQATYCIVTSLAQMNLKGFAAPAPETEPARAAAR